MKVSRATSPAVNNRYPAVLRPVGGSRRRRSYSRTAFALSPLARAAFPIVIVAAMMVVRYACGCRKITGISAAPRSLPAPLVARWVERSPHRLFGGPSFDGCRQSLTRERPAQPKC